MIEYAYLVMIGAVLAVVAASAMYTMDVREDGALHTAADAPETMHTAVPSVQPAISPLPTIAPLQVGSIRPLRHGGAVKPVSGEILRGFDEENPVLWEAIGCVQVHKGLDMAAQEGEDVQCAVDGVVTQTVCDALWGWRILIAQTDGCEALYAGLKTCVVQAGEAVTRGQTLGELAAYVPCEAELGPHLHLELRREGEPLNPEQMLPAA